MNWVNKFNDSFSSFVLSYEFSVGLPTASAFLAATLVLSSCIESHVCEESLGCEAAL